MEETEPTNSFVMIDKGVASRPSNIAAVFRRKDEEVKENEVASANEVNQRSGFSIINLKNSIFSRITNIFGSQ